MLLCFLVVLFNALLDLAVCFYQIPSYYGHWSLHFFTPHSINTAKFTYFQFNNQIALDYTNQTFYIAQTSQHYIESFNLVTKLGSFVAGNKGKSGNRQGDNQNAIFNFPGSLAFYQPNSLSLQIAQQANIYIVYNQSCDIDIQGCKIPKNQLQKVNISMQNIRIYPQFYLYPEFDSSRERYIYIADTQNHCIKKISLQIQIVQVIAGICGVQGFLDGPFGYNKLRKPSKIGVDSKGVIYFYDLGNQYMRKIQNNQVSTLMNGACKQFVRQTQPNRKIFNYELKKVICYQNWIQKKTKNPIQHYFQDTILNICMNQSSKCQNYGL